MQNQPVNSDAMDTDERSTDIRRDEPQLRICPGCRNQVHAESTVCAVCGKSVEMIRVRQMVRWSMLAVIVALVIFEFVFRTV